MAAQWLEGNLPENTVQVDATVLEAGSGEAEQLWDT